MRSHGLWVGPNAEFFRGRAHGELVHVHPSKRYRPRARSLEMTVASYGERYAFKIFGAATARITCDIDHILDRDWHAAQSKIHIGLLGLRNGAIQIVRQIAVNQGIHFGDSLTQCFKNLFRRDFLGSEAGPGSGERQGT